MTFQDFINVSTNAWNRYLRKVFGWGIELVDGGSLLYPNVALFVETDKYYLMELFGSGREFKGLSVKKHKEPNIYKYLYQFSTEGTEPNFGSIANAASTGFVDLTLSGPKSVENFETRFHYLKYFKQLSTLKFINANRSLLGFGNDFKSAFISRCTLLNSLDNAYR